MGRVLASSLCRETTYSEFCLATKQNMFFFCGEEKSPSIDHVAKTKLHYSNTNGGTGTKRKSKLSRNGELTGKF